MSCGCLYIYNFFNEYCVRDLEGRKTLPSHHDDGDDD